MSRFMSWSFFEGLQDIPPVEAAALSTLLAPQPHHAYLRLRVWTPVTPAGQGLSAVSRPRDEPWQNVY
jgi:hypothetical protein